MIIAIGLIAMTNVAYAKNRQVTVCTSYLIGASAQMTCSGGVYGETTILKLYQKGWHYVGDISGTNKFVLIFEK